MLKRLVSFAAVAMVALVVLGACDGDDGGGGVEEDVTRVPATGAPPTPTREAAATSPTAEGAASPVASPAASPVASPVGSPAVTPIVGPTTAPAEVTVEMVDIDFNPKEFTIPAGTDVAVHLPNHGAILHNFSVTEHKNPDVPNLGIDVDVQPGQSQTVTVNAPAGDYYFFCDVPGHEQAGMFGTMHVVAQ